MIFTPSLAISLLATSAFAVPNGMRPRTTARQSRPLQRLQEVGLANASIASNISYSEFTNNWAGAVLDGRPANHAFNYVEGIVTLPTPSTPEGSASVWVGIDGDKCKKAILQTGIDINIKNGVVSYDAWYEWYPDIAHYFDEEISFYYGDVVRLTVVAFSKTTGMVQIWNLSTAQIIKKYLSYPQNPLCQWDAEWIVEDFREGHSLVPLCNFGTVKFTQAYAYTPDGSKISTLNADVLEIAQKHRRMTSVSVGDGNLTIQYIGNKM